MAEARELPEEERSERSSQRENPRVSVIAPSLTDHDRGGSAISVGTPMALRLKGKSLMHLKEQYDNEERQSWLGRFKSALKEKIVLASFLAILGIIAALLKLGIDTVTDYTLSLRVIVSIVYHTLFCELSYSYCGHLLPRFRCYLLSFICAIFLTSAYCVAVVH